MTVMLVEEPATPDSAEQRSPAEVRGGLDCNSWLEREYSAPSTHCKVCGTPSWGVSYLCHPCQHLRDRVDTRWPVDKRARLRAMCKQWDPDAAAFLCAYTGMALTLEFGHHLDATWEHATPGDGSSVVLVADLVNKMKANMTDEQFRTMVRALGRHFDGQPFEPVAFPADPLMRD